MREIGRWRSRYETRPSVRQVPPVDWPKAKFNVARGTAPGNASNSSLTRRVTKQGLLLLAAPGTPDPPVGFFPASAGYRTILTTNLAPQIPTAKTANACDRMEPGQLNVEKD